MKLSVIENEQLIVTLDGQYIYLKSAAGELEFYREASTERFTLTRSAVYRVAKGEIGRLIVTPKFTGEVEIITGWGSFIPPSAGQPVIIESLPSVDISIGQKVALSEPVEIKVGQAVSLAEPVEIKAGQKVALSEPVEIKVGQAVKLSEPIHIVRDVAATLSANADDLPLSVAVNDARRVIIIKAPLSNSSSVLINQLFELGIGEKIKLETTAGIELTGIDGDRVCVLEY